MTDLTPEKRAELRERAGCRKVDGSQWVEVGPEMLLSLLDALDAAERELAEAHEAASGLAAHALEMQFDRPKESP